MFKLKKIVSGSLFFFILAFSVSCTTEDETRKESIYKISVINNSQYDVSNFTLNLNDYSGENDSWNVSSLASGETSETHEFLFVSALPGDDLNGNYGTFYGSYSLNGSTSEVLVSATSDEMTIVIYDDEFLDTEGSPSEITYNVSVVNNSQYDVSDFSIILNDASGKNSSSISLLSSGDSSEDLKFIFIEAEIGAVVVGNYGCYTITYIQNGSLVNDIIVHPNNTITLTISDSGFTY